MKSEVQKKAELLGYAVRSLHVNSADYGAAQARKRWVVIGTRDRSLKPLRQIGAATVRSRFSEILENWGLMKSNPDTIAKLSGVPSNRWVALSGGGFENAIRLTWDSPSPAIVNLKKVYMVHPQENRNISLAEAASLQGFPPGYKWKGTGAQIAQMIANAMPCELARTIAEALVN